MGNFYVFDQNNSGGSFITDSNLCHRIIIEADSEKEADEKALELGCYFDGVDSGMDCECCGDRWNGSYLVDFENSNERWGSMEVYLYDNGDDTNKSIESLSKKYEDYVWAEPPTAEEAYGSTKIRGKIIVRSVEEYAQIMANQWGGWTSPEIRIFYKDGSVKEFFEKK